MAAARRPREYFYAEVFRLPPMRGRPDHYTLLGLRYFEKDRDAILRAVMERTALLEACDAEPRPAYKKVLEQLRTEVREAQLTLLDEKRRAKYDASLIGASENAERSDEDDELELPPGTMFADRYRIMTEVRRGALGVVYEAMDKNLRSKVHLSVLRPKLSLDRRQRRPVANAARTMALLDHASLVKADEVGDSGGLLFLRTRAVEGRDLGEAISATPHGRFEPEEARRVARALAGALVNLHDSGAHHGDLRPGTVTLDDTGRVLVTDTAVARAVADAGGKAPTRYREPEDEASTAGDLFALGALLYLMLSGEPPFPAGARKRAAKPLPDHVPADLAQITMRLLARDPEQRPSAEKMRDQLTRAGAARTRTLVFWAIGAVVLVAALAAYLAGRGDSEGESVRAGVTENAYKLIVQRRFDDAIALLQKARDADPANQSLVGPLATAYERKAEKEQTDGDVRAAQVFFSKAQRLEPSAERGRALEGARRASYALLEAVRVKLPAVAAKPQLRVSDHKGIAVRLLFSGKPDQVPGGTDGDVFRLLGLDEGTHEVEIVLSDAASNERRVKRTVVVDRTPPEAVILEPADGAVLRNGAVKVVVQVSDKNPPARIDVRGRPIDLLESPASSESPDRRASDVFRLADGAHEIAVTVRDRAGHEVRVSRRVVVDTRGPQLELAAERLVTRDGRIVVRGRAYGQVASVTMGGKPVKRAADGSFAHETRAAAGQLAVVAVGPTGLKRKMTVEVVHDAASPEVKVRWPRRDSRGTLLYGAREMDRRAFVLPLLVTDATATTLHPKNGRIDGTNWILPALEGRISARLVVRDEAGNETTLAVATEGHRARPRLDVRAPAGTHWKDRDVVLQVDADESLFVQGRPAEPGRVELTLAEGGHVLSVRAVDRWGNETAWTRRVVIDLTPPQVTLVGEAERGIGKQIIELEANEALSEIVCFANSWPVKGRSVKVKVDLRPGRTHLTIKAKDLAGNLAQLKLPLVVRNRVLVLGGGGALRIDLPKSLSLDEFTIECWVRGTTPVGTRGVVSNYLDSDFALMWCGARSRVPYAVWAGEKSGRLDAQIKKEWNWSEWVHLALCWDGRRVKFYVNGSLQKSVPFTEALKQRHGPLWIGCDAGTRAPRYHFVGALDEVRLSSVNRYPRPVRPKRYLKADSHTVFLHRFDRRDGDKFLDESKNGFHAKVVGKVKLVAEER